MVGFAANFAATRARFAFIDKARIQIGIYGKLLTRHRVQGKARRHFSNSTCALGDHDKVDDDQNDENHDTNSVVSSDHELAKRSDYLSGGRRSFFGTMGKAASEVVLRSFSGRIRLKQR